MSTAHDLGSRRPLAQARAASTCARLAAALLACGACRFIGAPPAVPPSAPAAASPAPSASPGAPPPMAALRPVRRAPEEVVVAAWAEPTLLPPEGGEARLFVRAQKRNGQAFAGVEVRLQTSHGALASAGRLLVTDERGLAHDRLNTRRTATIVLDAGGTRYKFDVPVSGIAPTTR